MINATITFILGEQSSKFNNSKYFVIKCLGDDGIKYNITPSNDCYEYEKWQKIAKDYGIGSKMYGLQFQGKRGDRNILSKKVLPIKVEDKDYNNRPIL